jgi:hypothetical protein
MKGTETPGQKMVLDARVLDFYNMGDFEFNSRLDFSFGYLSI